MLLKNHGCTEKVSVKQDELAPTLSYDPSTKTLYIDSDSAQMLSLRDGDTLPVPNDILSQAIGEGQITLLNQLPLQQVIYL